MNLEEAEEGLREWSTTADLQLPWLIQTNDKNVQCVAWSDVPIAVVIVRLARKETLTEIAKAEGLTEEELTTLFYAASCMKGEHGETIRKRVRGLRTLSKVKDLNIEGLVWSRKGSMGGKPCVKGTRVSLRQIAEALEAGESVEEIIWDYDIDEETLNELLNKAERLG